MNIHVYTGMTFIRCMTDSVLLHDASQPWLFTEIKEQRHWDITSGERLNILKDFVHFGLEHWGSDSKGELSFLISVTNFIRSLMHQFSYVAMSIHEPSECSGFVIFSRCGDNTPFLARMVKLHLPLHSGWSAGYHPSTIELEATKLLWPG